MRVVYVNFRVRPFDGSFDRSLPAVVERNRDGGTIVHTLESLTIAPYQSVPPEKSFGNVPSAPDVRDRYRQTMEMTEAAQLNGVVENRTLERLTFIESIVKLTIINLNISVSRSDLARH